MDARTCMVLHGLRTAVVEANISANDVGRRNFVPELGVICKVRREFKGFVFIIIKVLRDQKAYRK